MSANKVITFNQTLTTNSPDNTQSISKDLNDIKMWIIIIAIIIIILVVIKTIKMCKSAYNKHNEKIIERANRVSAPI